MLDDRRRRAIELLNKLPGGVEVDQVVVRKLLAVELDGAGDAASVVRIQCGGLVGVLAVAEVEGAGDVDVEEGGDRLLTRAVP